MSFFNGPQKMPPPRPPEKPTAENVKVVATDDKHVHDSCAALLDFVHENQVVGVACVAFAADGTMFMRWASKPCATAGLNLAVDSLKYHLVQGGLRIKGA